MTVGQLAESVSAAQLVGWFRTFANVIEGRADELSALDAAIGDADHGTNLRRGCRAVIEALDLERPGDVMSFGRTVGMRLVSAVGGASGPLYGSFFLEFGTAGGAVASLDVARVAAAWRGGVDGVVKRGKAELGDKTMIDALAPAADALDAAADRGAGLASALADALAAAKAGMLATTPLIARKGRASYLGERSAGHQDPGATSSWLLVRAAAAALAP